MYSDITGIILSGGKSSRMGVNKSLMKFGDKTVIELLYRLMYSVFDRVILITNEPGLYEFLKIETFKDIIPTHGPLSGIHSGLVHSSTTRNFVISCDMPFIDYKAIEFITNFKTDKPISVPKANGYIQQLCGIYHKSLINKIEEMFNMGLDNEIRIPEQGKRKCSVHKLIDDVESNIIDMEIEYPEFNEHLFFNMNTNEDYSYVINFLNKNQ